MQAWGACIPRTLLFPKAGLRPARQIMSGSQSTLLDEIKHIDTEIDERVLDLYGITDAADRQRILGSAPVEEDEIVSEGEIPVSPPENF